MDEEEDWDAPSSKLPSEEYSSSTFAKQQENTSPAKTLKISDGYKYSYEAHASPANIEDWADEPSYASSNKLNGFGSANRSNRREKGGKRFESNQQGNWKGNSSQSFKNSRGNHDDSFRSRKPKDWDTPKVTTPDPWQTLQNASATPVNDDWDAPTNVPPAKPSMLPTPVYTSSGQLPQDVSEENWDDDGNVAAEELHSIDRSFSKSSPQPPPKTNSINNYTTSNETSVRTPQSMPLNTVMEKNWDAPAYNVTPNKPPPVYDDTRSNKPIAYDTSMNLVTVPTNQMSAGLMNNSHEENWDADETIVNEAIGPSMLQAGNCLPHGNTSFAEPMNSNAMNYGNPFSRTSNVHNSLDGGNANFMDHSSEFRHNRSNHGYQNKYPRDRSFDGKSRFRERDRYSGSHGPGGGRGRWHDKRDNGGSGGRRGGRDFRNHNRNSSYSSFGNKRSFDNHISSERSTGCEDANKVVAVEENWDEPANDTRSSGVGNNMNCSLPVAPIPIVAQPLMEEESWD